MNKFVFAAVTVLLFVVNAQQQVALAQCDTINNDIGGIVYRDMNENGVQDVLESGIGIAGMVVTSYDASNAVVATASVAADGSYFFAGIAGSDYRVELSGLPDYLQFGAVGSNSFSSVQFANVATCAADFGVNNPNDFCQANPDFIVSRFTKDERSGINTALNTILQYNYLDNGSDAPTNISNYGDIGSVYGLAHVRKANVTYASTYFKTHADIGPNGIGAIYKIDHNSGNSISSFVNLPGTDPRGGAGGAYDWDRDSLAYVNVGKAAIGDIELSDDENHLFAVNMEDRNLYILGVDDNGDLTTNTNVAIPNPCSNVLDYRPMGLGFKDGLLYVGVTCTAESTVTIDDADDSYFGPRKGTHSELSAHIYSFNPTSSTFSASPILDIDLDYQRGCAYTADVSNIHPPNCPTKLDQDGVARPFVANWNPWQMDFDVVFNDKRPGNIGNQDTFIEYQQPLLSDIEFDNNGTIIVQIKDVNGDRSGHQNLSPANPGDGQLHNGNSYGDILRACGNPVTGWTLESNGSCGGVTTGGANSNEGPDNGEFYWWDNGPGGNGNVNGSNAGHSETTMGGLLMVPGHLDVVTGVMGASGVGGIDNGLIWLQNSGSQAGQVSLDGSGDPKRLLVSFDLTGASFFGKASGIGDMEAMCDPAPVEIGNRVWNDVDRDGIQDADELGIDGITVSLTCGADSTTAVTANGGEYYFNNATTVNAGTTQALFMDSGENCTLSVDNSQAPLTTFELTLQDAQTNTSNNSATDVRDSDAQISGANSIINLTVGAAGQQNHSYDFGFGVPILTLGNYVWYDSNQDGIQDVDELGVNGVNVALYNNASCTGAVTANTTTANDGLPVADGFYEFTGLSAGDYCLEFTNIPAGYDISPTGAGTPATDSDADPTTGQITNITLTVDNPDEDMGIYIPGTVSGLVWCESNTNANTSYDVGDADTLQSNIAVTLYEDTNCNDTLDASEVATATTQDTVAGLYSFTDLITGGPGAGNNPPGCYIVEIDATDPDLGACANPITPAILTPDIDAPNPDSPDTNFGHDETLTLGDTVWYDNDQDGVQDIDEPGVNGITVTLYNNPDCSGASAQTTTTATGGMPAADGWYEFSPLPSGDYCIEFSDLPIGWAFTPDNQESDDTIDSDANPATGQISNIDLQNNNPNEDVGIYAATGTMHGNMFCDDNPVNGVQDADEQQPNLTINLYQDTDCNGTGDVLYSSQVTDVNGDYEFTNLPIAFAPAPPNPQVCYVVTYDTQDPDLGDCTTPILPEEGATDLTTDTPDAPAVIFGTTPSASGTPVMIPVNNIWGLLLLSLLLLLMYVRRYQFK